MGGVTVHNSILSTAGYKTSMPRFCLVAWGLLLPLVLCIQCKPVCICAPSHTPPPLALPVLSVSLCVWNLHNVVWPSRLIIHVLLTSPVSFVLSEVCLFRSFLGFMFPPAYPESVSVLTSVITRGAKMFLALRCFCLTQALVYSRAGDAARESASSQTTIWVISLFKVPGWLCFPVQQVLKRLSSSHKAALN